MISHHILLRVGGTPGVSFQHQQFQEWYASFEIADLMLAPTSADHTEQQTRRAIFNDYSWEEPTLFACERLSRGQDHEVEAVAASVIEALSIDPMLAAEMINRSARGVWERIRDQVVAFAGKWHITGTGDRAVRFMVSTAQSEFAPQLWPLICDEKSQLYYTVLRSGNPFRPAVLGTDRAAKIALLPDAHRASVMCEIASWSGVDGIELATQIAARDNSPLVRATVAEALIFRGAHRAVAEILRTAPDEVWAQLAGKGYEEVGDPVVTERLRRERGRLIESEANPLRKLHAELDAARDGHDLRHSICALMEDASFPVGNGHAAQAVQQAHELYPTETLAALVHRIENGLEIPYRTEDLFRAAEVIVDESAIAKILLEQGAAPKLTRAAAAIAGPDTVGKLIDLLIPIHKEAHNSDRAYSEAVQKRHQELSQMIANASLRSLTTAILDRSGTEVPIEIHLFAELLSRHSDPMEHPLLELPAPLHHELVVAVKAWADHLIGSTVSRRSHMAEVATVIGRLASRELVSTLGRMIAEDLKRWRASRTELLDALNKGIRLRSEAQASWVLQYRRAFAAIGDDAAVELLKSYLPDRGPCGFGVAAAEALVDIWKSRQQPPPDRQFQPQQDFTQVQTRRSERQKQPAITKPWSFGDDIIAVVNTLIDPTSDDESHAHAMQLACVALAMPYSDSTGTINALLNLSQPLRTRQKFFTALVLAGEVIKAETVLDCIRALRDESKTKTWMLSDQNWWEWESWLVLMPFTDQPTATIDAVDLLGAVWPPPWRLRGLLSALGSAPDPAASELLISLPRRDPRFLHEHDWVRALESRSVVLMARTLLNFIREGIYSRQPNGMDDWGLARRLASGISEDQGLRSELYQHYGRDPSGPNAALFEQTIAEVADEEGVLTLFRAHAKQTKAFSGALYSAIRHVVEGRRPSRAWAGAVEMFSRGVPKLRKELFAMTAGNSGQAALAAACLNAIDVLRDEYGRVESEQRHPDIDSGRAWPILELLCKAI